jgi:colanic acid/amylovoran biosynthesis glycosyltransferase
VPSWLPWTEIWIYNQLSYMTADVQSVVWANSTQNLDKFPWSPVYAMAGWQASLFRVMRRFGYRWYPAVLDQAIQKHRPAIIHSHFGLTGWFDLPTARKYGLKQVVAFYGFDVNMLLIKRPTWRKRYRELFSQADLFLCEGPYMAQSVVGLGCPPEKVRVHRLGVELEKIAFRPRTLEPGGPLRILIASSFREKKGIPYGLEAIGLLKQHYPNVAVTIVGNASSEARSVKEKEKILETIKRCNLESVTTLMGYQPHNVLMAEAYKHHIFLAPSVLASDGDSEGGAPVVIIDMLASGMPVVSTTHCDIPQIVEHGVTGFLAEERNVAALAAHLQWLADHPERWQGMMEHGRQYLEEKFDAHRQAEELVEIYRSINEPPGGGRQLWEVVFPNEPPGGF